jgi:hypothetical protein
MKSNHEEHKDKNRIKDDLLKRAIKQAAEEGRTLTALIDDSKFKTLNATHP